MKKLGEVIATMAVWGGVCVLSYIFHSSGILTGTGAAFMVIGALITTITLWD